MPRILKDGWPIHKEWIQYEDYELIYDEDGYVIQVVGVGKRAHWVETDCSGCGQIISMPLSKLVKSGTERCDGCVAYDGRYR